MNNFCMLNIKYSPAGGQTMVSFLGNPGTSEVTVNTVFYLWIFVSLECLASENNDNGLNLEYRTRQLSFCNFLK